MQKRRDVLKWAAAAAAGTGGAALGEGNKHLRDEVVDAAQAKVSHDPFGDTRVFFDGPTPQLKAMTAGSLELKAGMEPHPPHQHPEEEIMVVTSGSGEILVSGKTVKVGPGSMMYCEGNKLHGIKNTGAEPMLFYYYKWMA